MRKVRVLIRSALVLFAANLYSQQLPFHGTPASIPGLIEAEDFDHGGPEIAYYDVDPGNTGGAYRETDVDIENCSEGGYNIGWLVPGEWLEYTVDVAATGTYDIELRVASPAAGGMLYLAFDDNDVIGPISLENTNGWQTWATVTIQNVSLTLGQQVMRFMSDDGAYNLNSFNVISSIIPDPPQVEITQPLDNSEFFLGDDIQIHANATDINGTVESVEFYADNARIGVDTTEPYGLLWAHPEIGNYDLRAVATDNDGAVTTSSKVDVSVNFPEYDHEVTFSDEDPFHSASFDLTLSTGLSNAQIWYTLDGSSPLTSSSTLLVNAPAQINIDPQDLSGGRGQTPGVTVRALVMNNATQQSRIATRTYLFIDEVRNQTYPGGGWPDYNVNNQILDYDVNQDVVNDTYYSGLIDDALLDIPSLSLVTDLEHLFDSENGIYVNPEFHGREWERPVSLELLNPDGSPGFQIDAGLRIRGGWSRHHNFPKHSFRLFFREEYGENKLIYPMFGDEGVDEFKKMDLRTSQNYAWSNGYVTENTMNRDVFSRDLQAELGQPYTRSRYYHLYLNGMYWGLFQTQERPEANFAESYLGGNDNDYDVVKVDVGEDWNLYEIEATDGNLEGWQNVWDACQTGFSLTENYFALEGRLPDGTIDDTGTRLVDIDNLIDYMIIIFYTGNFDAPVSKFRGEQSPNNFYALYNRNANDGFVFLAHDSEHTLLVNPHHPGVGINEDRVNINPYVGSFETFHPQWLHNRLAQSPEYRLRFADRVYRHFFNDGAMKAENLSALFNRSATDIDMAIIGESMRWGDLQRSKLNAWEPAIDLIMNGFFPLRGDIVLDQLRTAELYPELEPPSFKIDGQILSESLVSIQGQTAVELEMSGSTGSIIYTLDGSDPRAIGGGYGASAFAAANHQLVNIEGTTQLKARVNAGGSWSALHEITFHSNEDLSQLILSEIHYHPLDEGETSGKYYEFLEVQNQSSYSLDLSLASFTNGIEYTFPTESYMEAGAYLVIASNAGLFEQRYGFPPDGQYSLQLNNGGERLTMMSLSGDTVINLRYDDELPWPEAPDGTGPSLTWTNETQNNNPDDPLNWVASSIIHGSPRAADPVAAIADDDLLPLGYSLSQNFPNPFNPVTNIHYGLAHRSEIDVSIYDLRGRLIQTLRSGRQNAGSHSVTWDATDQYGRSVSGGVYFYQLQARDLSMPSSSSFYMTKKMILLK